MASSSPSTQIQQFKKWFDSLQPVEGRLSAEKVAPFLRKSKLPQPILADIWELCDSDGEGFLTQSTFNLCMKLLVVAQKGQQPTLAVLDSDISEMPILEGITPIPAPKEPSLNPQTLIISPQAKQNYLNQFKQLNPTNNFVSGDQIRSLFIQSKLPTEVLAQIWNLSDPHDRGQLNASEFCIAVHLLHLIKSQQIKSLPVQLPNELIQSAQVSQPLPVTQPLPITQPPPVTQRQPTIPTPVVPPLPADLDYYGVSGQLKLTQLQTELNQLKMKVELEQQKNTDLEKTLGLEEISSQHYSENLNNLNNQIEQIQLNKNQLIQSIQSIQSNIDQSNLDLDQLNQEWNQSDASLEKLRMSHRMEEGFMSINKTSFDSLASEVNSLRQTLGMEPVGETLDEWELFNPYQIQPNSPPHFTQQDKSIEPMSPKSPFDEAEEIGTEPSLQSQLDIPSNLLSDINTESPAPIEESNMTFDDFFTVPKSKPKQPSGPLLKGGVGSISSTRSARKKDGKPRTVLNFDFAKKA